MTGIHLMRTGRVEANLRVLNDEFKLEYISELIDRKLEGHEKSALGEDDVTFYQRERERLGALLEESYQASKLPEAPDCRAALNDLLIRLRLGSL